MSERQWRDKLLGPYFMEQCTAEATAKYVVNRYHLVLARLPYPELATPTAGAVTVSLTTTLSFMQRAVTQIRKKCMPSFV